jgi:hypothetical protein
MTDREGQGNHLNRSQWGGISPRDIRIQTAAAPKASTEKKTSRNIAIQLSLRSADNIDHRTLDCFALEHRSQKPTPPIQKRKQTVVVCDAGTQIPGPLPDTSDTGLLKNAPAERAPEPRQKLKEGIPRALRSDQFSLPGLASGRAAFCCSMANELSIAVLKVMAAAGVHRILAEVASLTSTPD